MRDRTEKHDASIASLFSWLGMALAAFTTIAPPLAYFSLFYHFQQNDVLIEARRHATPIAELIRSTPGSWKEGAAILIAESRQFGDLPESLKITDSVGNTLAQTAPEIEPPMVSGSVDLQDADGNQVGQLLITRSVASLLRTTAAVAVAAWALAIVMYLTTFALPLRALKEAWKDLAAEKQAAEETAERLSVVIDNASEGIVTVSDQGVIEFFSATAETIFGYPSNEVIGQGIASLVPAIHVGRMKLAEAVGRGKPGNEFPVEYSASEVHIGGVAKYVYVIRDITERKEAEERLKHMANFDSLTQLPNRNLFHDRLAQAILRASRSKELVALLFLDLDRFKTVNDTLGHSTGDRLLQEVAKALQHTLRKSDTVARLAGDGAQVLERSTISRLGGDEFTVILEGIANPASAAIVAEKIIEAFKHPLNLDGRELYASTSIGIAIYPLDDINQENLVKDADNAMYRAKELGRNTYQFYTKDLNAKVSDRFQLEADLRKAIEHGEFILHYQPKVDIARGELVGVEALLRWQRPDRMVPPAEFIPILEDTGFIVPVGEWVLKAACTQAKEWQRRGMPPLSVAVNVSPRQFLHKHFVEDIARILKETDLSPEFLEIELTESLLMANTDYNIATLGRIADMGIKVSIDDFGTGYSSLGYLKRFSIDILKIDRSFVRDIALDTDDAAIATAIIALANSLKLAVVAEGVETLEQLQLLHQLGCHQVQGYLLARPMPTEALEQYVASSPLASLSALIKT